MKDWPALDVPGADDLTLAALDDFSPTAVEERGDGVRVFFSTREQRDAALAAFGAGRAEAVEVSDEDWAARSQQDLQPITVGRITITPTAASSASPPSSIFPIVIVITPSMGFGTGHHATTRLCLAALQTLNLAGAEVLDVGTGSGVLAIAAARLGAARARGFDVDPDAVQSANENLQLNRETAGVSFAILDLAAGDVSPADVVTANLTGAMLVKFASRILAATSAGGSLILSGILAAEEDQVRQAFSAAHLLDRAQENEWVCLLLKKR